MSLCISVISAIYTSSPNGEAGKIWTISKAKDGYDIVHLINLKQNTSTRWRDDNATYVDPGVLSNVSVKIYYEGSLASTPKVWWATPDSIGTDPANFQYGKANLLTQGSNWTTGSDANGNFITLTVPQLNYWDMIWIEKDADETVGSQVMLQDFESTGTLPSNWTPITTSDAPAPLGGSWSLTQPAGSTKELTVGSGGGIIKYDKGSWS
ncbi:glycoside hydrolase family 66 protein [Paenibacillus sp. URB8-2]|uniref:glycoside hydrolase family 66 protein n=1 Tax=Paenibacillus sp. URB8-2 TaxID=2741301 RepID=UPI0015BF8399|nr:glycoside hydrolase family 66 protein [Paenibacillus sp. URB8-2]BCG57678.1 hypothetical protein PUR_11030 [Paenibacillus sp. URB8-2]